MKISMFEPGSFSDKDLMKMEEDLMKMDPVSQRALIRQSAHQIDRGIQCYIIRPEYIRRTPQKARSVLRIALKTWERKGYDIGEPDIKYAYDALRRGDEFARSPIYHPPPPHPAFSESDLEVVERAIFERRSIRRFSDRDVSDDLLDKVLKAGTWAPCACSLQASRFIVVKEAATKELFIQPWAAPVLIVAGVDERPYQFIDPGYSPYLDLGAAIQNMLLMAHAFGLGTCWGTFIGELDLIRRKLEVPDYIKIITYVVLGWPEDNPTTVPRMTLMEFVSRERWSGA